MESPSTNVPVLYQNERKMKQATLPFGIMKHDSTACKKQKLDVDGTDSSSAPSDEDVQLVEVSPKTKVQDESQNNSSTSDTKCEASDSNTTGMKGNGNVYTEDCINADGPEGDGQDTGSTGGKVVNKPSEVIKVECNVRKIENNSDSGNKDNFQNNKRKLLSDEKLLDQKPPKRVKLKYNIDKLKRFEYKPGEPKVDFIANCKNGNDGGSDSVRESAEVNVEDQKSDNIKLGTESRNEDLQNKCITECLNVKDTMEVERAEILDGSKLGEGNYDIPHVKKKNSVSSEKGSEKALTPKQLERKAELAKRKEERELLQQEKERKKKEMKEEKDRVKQEKEEEKRKLKEEKEKKRQAEIELRNEEKRKKEEEKRKKEEQKLEEKRKKEEQKLEDKRKREEKKKEEEEELSKKKFKKEAEAFSSFFKKYDVKVASCTEEVKSSREVVFMPFTVKTDMRLAPINRNPMDSERRVKFEEDCNAQTIVETYLAELRSGAVAPKKSANTWPLEEKYNEVVVLDEGLDIKDEVTTIPQKRYNNRRPKLLQFHENRRPPYWGTWRKKSKVIRPKNPLGRDEIFDYEVDSDDEWEEEEPGESLHGSDDEKESEDEYEVDNDFFVPHGYLSDDENPEEEIISPETQKAKLKLLGEQFDMERNEKTKLLKPITIGCVWFKNESDEPASVNPAIVKFLNKRKAVPWMDNIPIPLLQDENTDPNEVVLSDGGTPTSAKKVDFPESAIPDLIALVHGSTNSRKNLAKAFFAQWNRKEEDEISKDEVNTAVLSQARISKKIRDLGKWEEFPEEGPNRGKWCWYVKKEIRDKYNVNIPVAKPDEISETKDCADMSKKASPSLITKFTKVLTEDERRNQITNVRKSLSAPKTLSEFSPNSPKLQFTPMKSVQKLQQFWARPSLNSKYSPGVSAESMDADVQVVQASSKKDNLPDVEEIEKSDSDKSGDDTQGIFLIDGSGDETKPEESSADAERNVASREDKLVSEGEGHVDKMDVSDPTSHAESREPIKETCSVSPAVTEKGIEGSPTLPPSTGQLTPGNPQEAHFSNIRSEQVERTSCTVMSVQSREKDCSGLNESKPVTKKRVAILFSAPRGCDIVKPSALPKKSTPSLDDVVKKYENAGEEGEDVE